MRKRTLPKPPNGRGQHALAAAQLYETAASLADKPRDAEEAHYRAADSFARAGDTARAEALYKTFSSRKAPTPSAERAS